MSDIDRSDEADARRFRWLLDGRGRFMERRWLCCSFPVSSQVEQDDARRAIDKAAIDEAEAWPI